MNQIPNIEEERPAELDYFEYWVNEASNGRNVAECWQNAQRIHNQQLQRALSKVKELVNETHRTELREEHEEYVAGFQDACSLLWTKVDRYQAELDQDKQADHLPDRPLNYERE